MLLLPKGNLAHACNTILLCSLKTIEVQNIVKIIAKLAFLYPKSDNMTHYVMALRKMIVAKVRSLSLKLLNYGLDIFTLSRVWSAKGPV
jgi:hypothetical protein